MTNAVEVPKIMAMTKFRILALRFSSIGDVVLQTAILSAIHETYGDDVEITFATSNEFSNLIEKIDFIKKVFSFDRKNKKFAQLLSDLKSAHKEKPFDLILDLHANLRSLRLRLNFLGVQQLVVDKRTIERALFLKFKLPILKINKKTVPQVERLMMDFQNIMHLSDIEPKTYSSWSNKETQPKKQIAILPSASFFYKRWPIESFVALTSDLLEDDRLTEYSFKILAGPDDDFCQQFSELEKKHGARLANLQGKTTLAQSCDIVTNSDLAIGNDSGLVHIAQTNQVKVISMFGPTHEDFGFAPYGDQKQARVLSVELSCRPCSSKGEKDCFRDKHYCMEMISVGLVKKNVLEMLNV